MKKSIAISLVVVFASAVADAQPASAPVDQTVELQRVLDAARALVCNDTLACWKRRTLLLDAGLETAVGTSQLMSTKLRLALDQVGLWHGQAQDATKALSDALKLPAITALQGEPWYKAPLLWFVFGALIATTLAIGVFELAIHLKVAQ